MKMMNKMLYTVFALQILIICAFSALSIIWVKQNLSKNYLDISSKGGIGVFFIQMLTYWVAYSHMIPISLYVVIELTKLGQANLINADVRMFFPEDMQFALCRNSDLVEELGQVEFVFSDKTGTLTQNKMEFKKC
jgi:phospholipid-transporting ATPase